MSFGREEALQSPSASDVLAQLLVCLGLRVQALGLGLMTCSISNLFQDVGSKLSGGTLDRGRVQLRQLCCASLI